MNDRRTQTSLPDGTSWRYGYDRLSQVVSGERMDAEGTPVQDGSFRYAYDPIGNRITANEAGVPWTYTTNSLNQYTSATEDNALLSFAYDLDGNMTYRPVDATSGWTQV